MQNTFDYQKTIGMRTETGDYTYEYDNSTGQLNGMNYAGGSVTNSVDYLFDCFGKTRYKVLDVNVGGYDSFYNGVDYEYTPNGDNTSYQVSKYTSQVGVNTGSSTTVYSYTYDDNDLFENEYYISKRRCSETFARFLTEVSDCARIPLIAKINPSGCCTCIYTSATPTFSIGEVRWYDHENVLFKLVPLFCGRVLHF